MRSLNTAVALAALAVILGCVPEVQAARAYIGTYTPDPADPSSTRNPGQGIYLATLDDTTGVPSDLKLVARTLSPTWLALSADHKVLYAVNEVASLGHSSGSITAYAVDAASGALKVLNVVDSGGPVPCFVSVHPSGKFLLVANYTGGSFSVTRIKPDGSLGETTDVVKPTGPMSVYQSTDRPVGMAGSTEPHGSHAHMIQPDPTGQYVLGADTGRDQILVWKLDTTTGKLVQTSVTKSLPGAGPRHFVFSPDGTTLYVLQEQDSRLSVYGFADGKLTLRGASVSSLPVGFQGGNTTSELLIDQGGKHLYGGNRSHDSIATFTVGEHGAVSLTANTHTEGTIPRSLAFDPTGKFLYSLNQNGDNLTTFRLGADGVPTFTGKFLAVGAPAVMVFLP